MPQINDFQSEAARIETEMRARAQARILESNQFLRASEIGKVALGSVENLNDTLHSWKRDHQIFTIETQGVDCYPIYALARDDGYKPYPEMKDILEALRGKTSWGLAFWFESPNGSLGGRPPRELMQTDRRAVLAAAKIEAVGIQHG